jgi:hypothetical protein
MDPSQPDQSINSTQPDHHIPEGQQGLSPKWRSPLLLAVITIVVLLVIGGAYAAYLASVPRRPAPTKAQPTLQATQAVPDAPGSTMPSTASPIPTLIPSMPPTQEKVNYDLDKNSSDENGLYINEFYKIGFRYPKDWRITQDGSGETHSAVQIENELSSIIIRMYGNDTSEPRQIDFERVAEGNLPSGPAIITSKEFMTVDGIKSLYVRQNDEQEGIFIFAQGRDIVIQAHQKDRSELLNLITSIKLL